MKLLHRLRQLLHPLSLLLSLLRHLHLMPIKPTCSGQSQAVLRPLRLRLMQV